MKRNAFVFAAALYAVLLFSGCRKTVACQAVAPAGSAPVSSRGASLRADVSSAAVSSQAEVSSQENMDVSQPGAIENQGGMVKTIRTDNAGFNAKFQKNPLDAAYVSEMKKALSNVDAVKVSDKYAGLWEKEIIHAYAALKKELAADSPAKWRQIEASQKSWESGKDAALKKIGDDAAAAGGSLGQVQAASDTMEYFRERAAALCLLLYGVDPNYTYAVN